MVKHIERAASNRQVPASRDTDLGILLALAYSAFVAELRESLVKSGYDDLSPSFGYVARNLADAPLTLTELADRLGITSPGALKIVQQMEGSGHLERIPDPTDARAKRLRLTRRGRAALAAARAFHERFERDLSERVGTTKAHALREVLGEIVTRHEAQWAPIALRPM
jgi:DNA-binding MarR family transcriptional regulator